MITRQESQEEIAEFALSEALRHGSSDASILCAKANDSQVRFANNEITLVNNVRDITLDIYLAKEKKRIVGSTFNPTEEGIKRFITNLVRSCEALPVSEDYVPLPQGPFSYRDHSNFDSQIADAPLVEFVRDAIDQATGAGAVRASGSLNTEFTELFMITSAGSRGKDRQTQILLNVRAFADDNASGHGLSCSSYMADFHPGEAGRRAGEFAKRALNPKQVTEGKYNVVFSPTVVSNILPVGSSASAFAIESGNSFLVDKLGKGVAIDALTVEDYGVYDHGLGGRVFDDEGVPTGINEIIDKGVFQTILHNSSTAKKFGKDKSTGNAGIIAPRPTSLVFNAGNASLEEMIHETGEGLFVTNNWYTRYQNMQSGDYSTVPRDAAFRIQGGEISEPVAGFRLSDSVPRQLLNIEMISRDRDWIKWWEVTTPTLAPAMMIKEVGVTRAVGS
ncbi:MAG: TldD/PmbA family protein [Thaumarchaeota archaeon]|nr:TldD/PmbA family protein [Nitrososphaerota archaeon]